MKREDGVYIVTGCTSGLGAEVCKQLLDAGKRTIGLGRKEMTSWHERPDWTFKRCDVRDSDKLRYIIRWSRERFGKINGIVSNAGEYGSLGKFLSVSEDMYLSTLEVNTLAPLAMLKEYIRLQQSEGGRFVQVSGGGATSPLTSAYPYMLSKVGVVRLMEAVASEDCARLFAINCVAPGPLNTAMLDKVLETDIGRLDKVFVEKAKAQKRDGGASIEEAARCIVSLLTAKHLSWTGRLISAVWDDWESMINRDIELEEDVFRLRRVVK